MAKETIYIPVAPKIWSRIMDYAYFCNTEVAGFGHFNVRAGIVDTLFPLLPQSATGASAEIDENIMEQLATSPFSAKVNVFWHSHCKIGVMWSSADEQTIAGLGKGMNWMISVVVNQKGDHKTRIDFFNPVRVVVHDVEAYPRYSLPISEQKKVKEELKKMVLPPKKLETVHPFQTFPPYGGNGEWRQKNRPHSTLEKYFGAQKIKSLKDCIMGKNGMIYSNKGNVVAVMNHDWDGSTPTAPDWISSSWEIKDDVLQEKVYVNELPF